MSVVGSAFGVKHRRLGGVFRCLRHYFPSILTFLFGFFFAGFIMISFDSVTPCGKSLTDTILNSVANVTKTSWDTSHSKYKIQCPRYPPNFGKKKTHHFIVFWPTCIHSFIHSFISRWKTDFPLAIDTDVWQAEWNVWLKLYQGSFDWWPLQTRLVSSKG